MVRQSPDTGEEGKGESPPCKYPLALSARASPASTGPLRDKPRRHSLLFIPNPPMNIFQDIPSGYGQHSHIPRSAKPSLFPAPPFPFKYSRLSFLQTEHSSFPRLVRELDRTPTAYSYTYPSCIGTSYMASAATQTTHCPPSAKLGVKSLQEIHEFLLASIKSAP